MRRQNTQLIALVRQGDSTARREVGRRYLLGTEGFPRHVPTGIDYLTHISLQGDAQAARIVGESLPMEEIAQLKLGDLLAAAAQTDSAVAKLKYAVWLLAMRDDEGAALKLLADAAAEGQPAARRVLQAVQNRASERTGLYAALRALETGTEMDVSEVALLAAESALEASDLDRLLGALDAAIGLRFTAGARLDGLVAQAARLAESMQRSVKSLPAQQLEDSLDRRAHDGDSWAAFALGRALSGIDCGSIRASELATSGGLRRGTALLFRAADAGWTEAWLHLYRLHADQKLAVANSQLARFCLEKAATVGHPQAQTKLGALMLRSANSLGESEQAIGWLHKASVQGDEHASILLRSLHLPVLGSDEDARAAIDLVRADYPWLALRMQLSRDFGLTKLEALCVDPADGLRPWGLVIGKNPFIVQSRLSAARAIPALSPAALDNLRRSAMAFSESGLDGYALEGDARRRSLLQRRAFERLGLDEAMFFAKASTKELDTLRQGPRWAFRVKALLQLALAV